MQRAQQNLIYALTGQVIEFYPPQSEIFYFGRPSSAATYKCWAGTQSMDDTVKFSGTATLDSVSAALTASSGISQTNRRRINVASTNVAIGRTYLLESTASQREFVIAQATGSGTVDVENDLVL